MVDYGFLQKSADFGIILQIFTDFCKKKFSGLRIFAKLFFCEKKKQAHPIKEKCVFLP